MACAIRAPRWGLDGLRRSEYDQLTADNIFLKFSIDLFVTLMELSVPMVLEYPAEPDAVGDEGASPACFWRTDLVSALLLLPVVNSVQLDHCRLMACHVPSLGAVPRCGFAVAAAVFDSWVSPLFSEAGCPGGPALPAVLQPFLAAAT